MINCNESKSEAIVSSKVVFFLRKVRKCGKVRRILRLNSEPGYIFVYRALRKNGDFGPN